MEIEELEIFDFLKQTTPLEDANDKQIISIINHIKTHYQKRGNIIEINEDSLYLIHKGAVSIEEESDIIEVLAEKDWLGNNNALLIYSHIAKEDTLYYTINKQQFFTIFEDNSVINQFFTSKAISYSYESANNLLGDSVLAMSRAINAVFVSENATISDVAKVMDNEKTTAVLVQDDENKLLGIITDRAFCTKVVAQNLSYDTMAKSIMTKDPLTIKHYENGVVAMMEMAKKSIRHLPIEKNNKIVGMLTAADLLRKQSHNVVFLLGEIKQAQTVDELVQISKHLPLILTTGVSDNMDEHDIAYLLSTIGRSIIVQLINQFENNNGKSELNYAFVVAGSLARGEQILHSDQDNLMILGDDYNPEKHNEYFINLAKYISDGLNSCGYIYCPGDVMATNDKWRASLKTWKKYFKKWITEPEPKSLMYASIFFDMKFIYGDKNLFDNLQNEVLILSKNNKIFLSHMAANARQYSPPLGIFRNFLLDKNELQEESLDMKKRGITPIVDMIRVYALSNGVKTINTLARINELIAITGLSSRGGRDLIDAYKFINTLRIKHQANQIKQEINPNNYIEPIEISSLDKKHLKDVFKIVLEMQDAMENSYQTGIL